MEPFENYDLIAIVINPPVPDDGIPVYYLIFLLSIVSIPIIVIGKTLFDDFYHRRSKQEISPG